LCKQIEHLLWTHCCEFNAKDSNLCLHPHEDNCLALNNLHFDGLLDVLHLLEIVVILPHVGMLDEQNVLVLLGVGMLSDQPLKVYQNPTINNFDFANHY